MIQQTANPLFSDDMIGFAKAVLLIAGPIFAGVLLVLKLGTRETISVLRRDVERADEALKLELETVKRTSEKMTDTVKNDVNGLGTRVDNIVVEMTRVRTDIDTIRSSIAESQRDILLAISTSSDAQLRAVHFSDLSTAERIAELRIGVAKLQERNDIASQLANSLESLAASIREPLEK